MLERRGLATAAPAGGRFDARPAPAVCVRVVGERLRARACDSKGKHLSAVKTWAKAARARAHKHTRTDGGGRPAHWLSEPQGSFSPPPAIINIPQYASSRNNTPCPQPRNKQLPQEHHLPTTQSATSRNKTFPHHPAISNTPQRRHLPTSQQIPAPRPVRPPCVPITAQHRAPCHGTPPPTTHHHPSPRTHTPSPPPPPPPPSPLSPPPTARPRSSWALPPSPKATAAAAAAAAGRVCACLCRAERCCCETAHKSGLSCSQGGTVLTWKSCGAGQQMLKNPGCFAGTGEENPRYNADPNGPLKAGVSEFRT